MRGLTLGEVAGGGLEPADEGRVAVQRPRRDSDPPFAHRATCSHFRTGCIRLPSKEADPEGYLRAAAVLRACPWVLGGAVNSAGQIVASDTEVQVYRES